MSDLSIKNACHIDLDFWKWLTLLGGHNQHSNLAQSLIHLSGGFSLFPSPELEMRHLFFLLVYKSSFLAFEQYTLY